MKYRLALLLLPLLSFALAATPEGTRIEAQASAGYVDSANQARTTTSNMVVTVVQQVYGVAVTPDGSTADPGQSRSGIAGSSVDFAYTLRNTGNGRDTFALAPASDAGSDFESTLAIHRDANCNGRRDSGEGAIADLTLDMNASACLVLAATLPSNAADGESGHANLSATAQAGAGAVDDGNWARATSSDVAVLSAFVLASPSSRVDAGETIDFVLTGTNVGGSAAFAADDPIESGTDGILIEATVPTGLTFGDTDFEAGAGTGTVHYFDGANWSTTASAGVTKVRLLLVGSDGFFVQGAAYRLTYSAAVPGDAASATQVGDPGAGEIYESSARVLYRADGTGPNRVAEANGVTHEVAGNQHVLVGPYQLATGDYVIDGRTLTRSADAQTLASAFAGNTISFRNTVRNDGNGSDAFEVALAGVPAGWSCGTYGADGSTPTTVVGPIDSLASAHVVVRCSLPSDAEDGGSVVLTAASTSDATVSDATTNTVTAVASGYGLSFGPDGTSVTAAAGATASFELTLGNDGQNADSFALATTANGLGAGSTVAFYLGCGAERSATPVSSTGLLDAGESVCITAVVSVPADATSASEDGTRDVTFTATSAGNAAVVASVTQALDVNHRGGVSFGPSRAGTVTSPGVIGFDHILRNTGNTSATAAIPTVASVCDGCSIQYSLDGSDFEPALGGVALTPGESTTVTVRLTVPSGEPIGRRLSFAPQATLTYADPGDGVTDGATDTVDVIGGELRLGLDARTCADAACSDVVSEDGAAAEPDEYVEYTIRAENLGTAPLTQVVITDPLPAFTDFVSIEASADFTGTPLYSTDGSDWSEAPSSGLVAGESAYVAIDIDDDGGIGATDTVPVAGVITIVLVTQVQ